MTLEELNLKIKKTEEELKSLKKERLKMQSLMGFGAEKEAFFNRVNNAIDKACADNDMKDFINIAKKHPDLNMGKIKWNWVYIYKNRPLHWHYHLQYIWNAWIAQTIRMATKGRASGLVNRKTGELNLTEEEIQKVKNSLNEKIDDWCRHWAS